MAVALGMFGFAYALVPIYNTLCRSFGINGKPELTPELPLHSIVQNRTVIVEFTTTENKSLPWVFYPKTKKVAVHPGESAQVVFHAKNKSDHTMTVQAIPSITPGPAAKYFKKTECFCFVEQTLKSQESTDYTLLFHLDPKLPTNVNTLTLAYTLFDITQRVQKYQEKNNDNSNT